jgi:hypothetical protein
MLHTPLAATAGALIGLLLLIIPLRHLTSRAPVAHQAAQGVEIDDCVMAWASLRLLAPAESVVLRQTDGAPVWSAGAMAAGEHGTRLALPPLPGKTEFILEITFQNTTSETAAFLTLAPDGLEEVTCHAIGRGTIRELLRFEWTAH